MENGPVEGTVTFTFRHEKVYYIQKFTIYLLFAENVKLLCYNMIKLINWETSILKY